MAMWRHFGVKFCTQMILYKGGLYIYIISWDDTRPDPPPGCSFSALSGSSRHISADTLTENEKHLLGNDGNQHCWFVIWSVHGRRLTNRHWYGCHGKSTGVGHARRKADALPSCVGDSLGKSKNECEETDKISGVHSSFLSSTNVSFPACYSAKTPNNPDKQTCQHLFILSKWFSFRFTFTPLQNFPEHFDKLPENLLLLGFAAEEQQDMRAPLLFVSSCQQTWVLRLAALRSADVSAEEFTPPFVPSQICLFKMLKIGTSHSVWTVNLTRI